MHTENIYLTQEGADKIRKELEILTGPRRREIAERLRFAVQQGDLSENADYISAKEDQAFLEGKILELEEKLRRAVIIGETSSLESVDIGSTVVVQLSEDEQQTFRVVGTTEADPRNGLISHQSPYGQALLGKRVGDIARANTPGGIVEFKIIDIR